MKRKKHTDEYDYIKSQYNYQIIGIFLIVITINIIFGFKTSDFSNNTVTVATTVSTIANEINSETCTELETSSELVITTNEINKTEHLETEKYNNIETDNVKYDSTFKAYMDYRAITNKESVQYKLQQQAYTDENGMRKINNYYCIALGTFYTSKCGEQFKIVLDNKTTFNVIVSDIKSSKHTDTKNKYTPLYTKNGNLMYNKNGIQMINILEFIVDTNKLPISVKKSGSVSSLGFEGNIISIKKIGELF